MAASIQRASDTVKGDQARLKRPAHDRPLTISRVRCDSDRALYENNVLS
jgi:hypothetical protein